MAYLLSSERPAAAAFSLTLVRFVLDLPRRVADARARHVALATLLEMDDARLDDLGLDRLDIREAMRTPQRDRADALAAARRRRSHAWPRSQRAPSGER